VLETHEAKPHCATSSRLPLAPQPDRLLNRNRKSEVADLQELRMGRTEHYANHLATEFVGQISL